MARAKRIPIEDYIRITNQYYLAHEALQAVMLDREGSHMTKVGQYTVDHWTVTAWLINPLRAHGGLVMIEQKPSKANGKVPGQTPDYSVYVLEEYYRNHQEADNLGLLIGKCKQEAQRLCREQAVREGKVPLS